LKPARWQGLANANSPQLPTSFPARQTLRFPGRFTPAPAAIAVAIEPGTGFLFSLHFMHQSCLGQKGMEEAFSAIAGGLNEIKIPGDSSP
jgi:hypothetical protein